MIACAFSVHDLRGYALQGLDNPFPAIIPGKLHDLDGFPSIVHGANGVVHGTLWWLAEEGRDTLLSIIDAIHGVASGRNVRTLCVTTDGSTAFSWHAASVPTTPMIPDGRWNDAQPRLI